VRLFVATVPLNYLIFDDCKQLLRSSGSIGANYIEAREASSKKEFLFRIKICRKESKETAYWLRLLQNRISQKHEPVLLNLLKESQELIKIFSAISRTTTKNLNDK
jgi:four helix bundle protein